MSIDNRVCYKLPIKKVEGKILCQIDGRPKHDSECALPEVILEYQKYIDRIYSESLKSFYKDLVKAWKGRAKDCSTGKEVILRGNKTFVVKPFAEQLKKLIEKETKSRTIVQLEDDIPLNPKLEGIVPKKKIDLVIKSKFPDAKPKIYIEIKNSCHGIGPIGGALIESMMMKRGNNDKFFLVANYSGDKVSTYSKFKRFVSLELFNNYIHGFISFWPAYYAKDDDKEIKLTDVEEFIQKIKNTFNIKQDK